MKNIYNKVILILLTTFLFAGCEEDILDKAPYGGISEASFYKTETDAVLAVNSVYDWLQGFWISTYQFATAIWSDDYVKGGGGASDSTFLDQFSEYRIPASGNFVIGGIWSMYYQGVFRANVAIEKIPEIDMDQTLKNRLVGEAKFLRALFYYNLNVRFGGVPLVASTNLDAIKEINRASSMETFEFIVNDLQDAIASLPDSYPSSDVGRATKGSAQALLGRVYLFMKNWQGAADVYSDIISDNNYSLLPNYSDNFSLLDNNAESLFEVQYASASGEGGWPTPNGSGINTWIRPRTGDIAWGGNGFALPTQSLVDAFEPGDARRTATVMMDGDVIFGDAYQSAWSFTGYNARKYVFGVEVVQDDGDANYKVIRYSEVLLGYAEAIQMGASGSASISGLEALNLVRNRAGLADIPALSFDAIVQERRVELSFERLRFFDLVRWGIAGTVLAPDFDVNRDEVFPIPLNEMLINPNIMQNPGY